MNYDMEKQKVEVINSVLPFIIRTMGLESSLLESPEGKGKLRWVKEDGPMIN